LAWTQEDLAKAAHVSIPTVKRLEASDGPLGGRSKTVEKLQGALEATCIDFIAGDGGGPGVRLQGRKALVSRTRTLEDDRNNVNSNYYAVPMKAIQLRMARAAVGWGVRELAEKAGVTANTVTRIENGADAKQSTMDKLQLALEAAGVEFTHGDQPGVRLTKSAAARSRDPAGASKRMAATKAVGGKAADKKR